MPVRGRSGAALRGRLVTAESVTMPSLPAIVVGRVSHSRLGQVRHSFRHGAYLWLVDLDAIPEPPAFLRPFAGFSSADHLGDPAPPIKANVERFLACAASGSVTGSGPHAGQRARLRARLRPAVGLLVLRRPRRLACVVAEVHNTYGDATRTSLRPDADGNG